METGFTVNNSSDVFHFCESSMGAVNPLQNIRPSAPVRMAIRLYATGACKTKRAASAAAGLHPAYLSMLTNANSGSDYAKKMLDDVMEQLDGKTVDMSVIVQRLGRLGLGKMAQLAMTASTERVQLDAAKSLADRSPETAGIQKIQTEGLTIGALDAKALADALVESAKMRALHGDIAVNGLVEVDISQGAGNAMQALPSPQGEAAQTGESGGDNSQGSTESTEAVQPQLRLI